MTHDRDITRSGSVALLGRSNVGKSTLLNAALQLPLAIVSRKPQTTRVQLLGVVRHAGAEIGLLDTPGIHQADSRLGKEMNRVARIAARDADVVAFVACLPPRPKGALKPHPADLRLLQQLPDSTPVVLVINKVDLLRDKRPLLPLITAYCELREFAAVVPISALRADGITLVLDEVAKQLPEGRASYDEDTITDRPLRHFAAEYVREPILEATGQEVPHAVAITIDELIEPTGKRAAHISATIHVERVGQKRIVIGHGGAMLKRIGIAARERIEALMGCKVNLKLWVRVTPKWREQMQQLSEFGLMSARGERSQGDKPSATDIRDAVAEMQRLAAEEDELDHVEVGEDAGQDDNGEDAGHDDNGEGAGHDDNGEGEATS